MQEKNYKIIKKISYSPNSIWSASSQMMRIKAVVTALQKQTSPFFQSLHIWNSIDNV